MEWNWIPYTNKNVAIIITYRTQLIFNLIISIMSDSDRDSDDDSNTERDEYGYNLNNNRQKFSGEIYNRYFQIGGDTYDRATVTEIRVREGTTSIAEKTFGYCDKLVSVILPVSVTEIEDETFRN